MGNIEILIHNLAMAAWDAGCESGVVWCPDADMSKRGVVPMTQEEGLRNSREHFATHGGGAEASEFDSALRSLRAALVATPPPDVVTVPREEWEALGQIVTLVNKHINDPCYLRNQLVPIVDRVSALRSGEAGKGAG